MSSLCNSTLRQIQHRFLSTGGEKISKIHSEIQTPQERSPKTMLKIDYPLKNPMLVERSI